MINLGRQAETLKKMVSENKNSRNFKVLTVSSGKGGVGKTNLVTNLAYALSQRGRRVLVVDADIGLNNIDILLGMAPKFQIQHFLSGEKSIEEVIFEGPGGIKVLPASNGIQELTQLENHTKLALLEELDRISDGYDFLIFDTGAGISGNVTYFCSAAHDIILLATTEPTSHTDVYALMKVLSQKYQQKRFRLLINMVNSENEALDVFQRLSAVADKFLPNVSLDYLGFVLSDPVVSKSVRQQKPFVELYPHSKASGCVNNLSEKLFLERSIAPREREQSFFWKSVLHA